MILNSQEIKNRSSITPAMIFPWNASNQRLSSYDLTIGDEFYAGCDGKSNLIDTQSLRIGQSFSIPAHGVCFILSEEVINLPVDVAAKLSLRMTHVYAGLVLTSQPPFDPGYHGKAVVMVHNLSSRSHSLKRGDRIATIEFSQVSVSGVAGPISGSPIPHRSVINLLAQLKEPVRSSLSEISEKAAATQRSVYWLAAQVMIFAALIVAIVALPGFYSYVSFNERLGDQKNKIEEMGKTIDDQKRELKELEKKLSDGIGFSARPDSSTSKRATQPRANRAQAKD